MSRHRAVSERLLWMALIGYARVLLWGEALRDRFLSSLLGRQARADAWNPPSRPASMPGGFPGMPPFRFRPQGMAEGSP